jgi:hypothetical protein
MAGGESSKSDILYRDSDICILRPDSKRGIEVFTISGSHKICTEGLLSYNELRRRHPEYGLTSRKGEHKNANHDNLIFFRAPYNSDIRSFESSYDGKSPADIIKDSTKETAIATIRVDPDRSFVYYSEARVVGTVDDIRNSRLLMKDYIEKAIPFIKGWGINPLRYIYTGSNKLSDKLLEYSGNHGEHITRFFELVAHIPHIPPEWFVTCHTDGRPLNTGKPPNRGDSGASRSRNRNNRDSGASRSRNRNNRGSGASRSRNRNRGASGASGASRDRRSRSRNKRSNTNNAKKTFKAEWVLHPRYGDEVPRCPKCGATGGTSIDSFTHYYDCPYKGRLPAPKS